MCVSVARLARRLLTGVCILHLVAIAHLCIVSCTLKLHESKTNKPMSIKDVPGTENSENDTLPELCPYRVCMYGSWLMTMYTLLL